MLKELIKKRKFRKGFTLMEIIIVIGIIGILATIAIPKFTGVAEEATKKSDVASARTIASAVTLALNESDGDVDTNDVNKYLSNIDVRVVNAETDTGWSVVFKTSVDDKNDFIIFKDGKPIFPSDETTD